MPLGTGYFFQAMMGALAALNLAGMKWFGVVPDNPARGLPSVVSLIALNDLVTGQPVAVMDGNWVTGARTAAMTAAAAKPLAPPDAETIAFIGCGTQARSHALFLRNVLPGLRRATCSGVVRRVAMGSPGGYATRAGRRLRKIPSAIAGADIAVSTVPNTGWQAFRSGTAAARRVRRRGRSRPVVAADRLRRVRYHRHRRCRAKPSASRRGETQGATQVRC